MNIAELNKELDKTKARVFIGTNAAFLGSLMCSMKFEWSTEHPTAATDGATVWWNPDWFETLSKDQRVTVLLHELWHPARLHLHRKGSRDSYWWNVACDFVINNDMIEAGYIFGDIGLINPDYSGMCEEDIYDILSQNSVPLEESQYIDLVEPSKEALQETVNNVVRSMHEANQAGMGSSIPGCTSSIVKAYLTPVVPWERLLDRFIQDLLEEDYSWSKPNRRYQDVYLPHRFQDEGKLEKLNYYLDVSGSISDEDILRFNSEIKFIKDRYSPVELNLIQFDTSIHSETTIFDKDDFTELNVIGRGGTSLIPVRNHIIDSKPTAAIIFTDLMCHPMLKLPTEIPVIWIVIGNPSAKTLFGEVVHIKDSQ